MLGKHVKAFRAPLAACLAAAFAAWGPSADARVTRIVIDSTDTPLCLARNSSGVCTSSDARYEQITGRAFGELDPNDAHNGLITDIHLAPRNANGNVGYIASFIIRRPTGTIEPSGVMWHDVPNRGGDVPFPADSRAANDVQLLSGWQGDNAGGTTVPTNVSCLPPYLDPCAAPAFANHYVKAPVLVGVTGQILGRIVNRSGTNSQPLNVMGNPIPYLPATLDTTQASLVTHTKETLRGVVTEGETISSGDWAFARCGIQGTPAVDYGAFPGTPQDLDSTHLPGSLPVHVCLRLRNGFDPNKLYQLVYTAKNPYVLGAGTAAFRDVGSFFKYASADDFGTANPLAGKINWEIIRGSSQSGNFTRHLIFLGMNEDEAGRIVHDGAWPLIAGRRVAN